MILEGNYKGGIKYEDSGQSHGGGDIGGGVQGGGAG